MLVLAMYAHDLSAHAHHRDLAPPPSSGERRTRWVVALTLVMMVGEIVAGQRARHQLIAVHTWRIDGLIRPRGDLLLVVTKS